VDRSIADCGRRKDRRRRSILLEEAEGRFDRREEGIVVAGRTCPSCWIRDGGVAVWDSENSAPMRRGRAIDGF
jgi:hypothetical protein